MEATTGDEIPTGPGWQYEPKWDGFRCLAFRDGDRVELQSKSAQPLARYFPELVQALLALKAKQFVLDGEIIVVLDGNLSFDELLMRIHPAESRIRKLAAEHPAQLVVFDLLVDDKGKALVDLPLEERRERLEAFAPKYFPGNPLVALSPVTRNLAEARRWFHEMGGGLDGIVAKERASPYLSGERAGMQKIKNLRTADCVVGGFRYASSGRVVGSLLLGLYDSAGSLHHVGFTSSIHAADKKSVTAKLEKLIAPPGFTGRAPGGPSRWSTKRSSEWEPLKPELVIEVQYDHFSGGRFRHGTKLLRWRPDKAPRQCKMAQ
ncbi:MAG: ATP-dependent DNA ligase, partial [Acidobacteriota bacterium]|nr:ATP-dependent DNA ligase [Acidobacteriota bacterium]